MPNRNQILLWSTCSTAAVVITLSVYSALAGGSPTDHRAPHRAAARASVSASAADEPVIDPPYTIPSDWTEPTRWAALPAGTRTDSRGAEVGFPHSVDGAVALLAAADDASIEGARTTVKVQLDIYHSYTSSADQTATREDEVRASAVAADADLRQSMGLSSRGPWPAGAYVHATAVGFKMIREAPDEVAAYLLTRVASRAGETAAETTSYTVGTLAAVWEDGDWKASGDASASADAASADVPDIAAPGDAAFNAAGWTAIREAS